MANASATFCSMSSTLVLGFFEQSCGWFFFWNLGLVICQYNSSTNGYKYNYVAIVNKPMNLYLCLNCDRPIESFLNTLTTDVAVYVAVIIF